MNKLRPVHFAVLAAFVAGVFVTLGVSSVLGGNDGDSDTQAVVMAATSTPPAATATAAVSTTPRVAATTTAGPATSTATPAVAPPAAPANPAIGTGAANPGICSNAAAAAYVAKSLPILQTLGTGYVTWQSSVIPTTAEEMTVLKQILAPFIANWEADQPVPDGCIFVHNRVLTAAKNLADTANRAPTNNTPVLSAVWDTEYNGRTGEMKAALDQYFQVTAQTVSPRPFP